jgi:hypothetical protein
MHLASRAPLGLDRFTYLARGGRLLLVAALVACGGAGSRDVAADTTASTCGSDARRVVERLGVRMREVSLLAPDSVVRRELASAYEPLVTTSLLRAWQSSPAEAPGREVSNPWPARIEVRSVEPDAGGCRVEGEVVYVTSADTSTAVERRRVTIRVTDDHGWRASAYESPARGRAARDSTIADVIRRYYAAIANGDFDAAYSLWGDDGRASGQSRSEFAAGFAQTERVRVTVGDDIALEGAAGSQYATVPVTVDAVLRDGRRQHFEGTYTLRRSMVDGARAEQRRWRIYEADLRER